MTRLDPFDQKCRCHPPGMIHDFNDLDSHDMADLVCRNLRPGGGICGRSWDAHQRGPVACKFQPNANKAGGKRASAEERVSGQ